MTPFLRKLIEHVESGDRELSVLVSRPNDEGWRTIRTQVRFGDGELRHVTCEVGLGDEVWENLDCCAMALLDELARVEQRSGGAT